MTTHHLLLIVFLSFYFILICFFLKENLAMKNTDNTLKCYRNIVYRVNFITLSIEMKTLQF